MEKQSIVNTLPSKEKPAKLNFKVQEIKDDNKNSIKNFIEINQKKQSICHICNKPFSTIGNMRNHIMTIHQNYRPYSCIFPGCNKKYSIESRYQVHLRTHIGAKPFICQICNKSFNEKGNLKTHLRFHSELRPFKCPNCPKSYKTNGHLKDHIEIQHNLIKKYSCQFCNKKFGRISTLKAHIRTHTGEKNYKCKMIGCDKWFAEKGNMEIHYRRHLKKLNRVEINAKKRKKYGEKKIIKDYEEIIKQAIDKLKDVSTKINTNKEANKTDNKNINEKKPIIAINDNKISKLNIPQGILQNNNFVNSNFIYKPTLNNVNILPPPNTDKINNFRFINESNFNSNINNVLRNFTTLNNFPNNGNENQNFLNNGNENQNFLNYLPFYPLIQEFQPIDHLFNQDNNNLFNKENNDINNIDIANCATRPGSNTTLCIQKKPEETFAKEEDLFSVGEDFSKANNCKINNENLYENENINMRLNPNYDFLENQQGFINEERMNNFNYNFNDLNEAKILHIKCLDKNYII